MASTASTIRGWAGRTDPQPRRLIEAVLRMIWKEQLISRVAIARLAGLSRSTVTVIVGKLLEAGLVREVGRAASKGGRRPVLLEVCYDQFTILGVEIGASHVAAAAVGLRGQVHGWAESSHPVRDDPVGARAKVIALCEDALAQAGPERGPLVGIGVAMPAPVDPNVPDHVSINVLPRWEGRSGLKIVANHFDVPLLVDNDANLGALAEHWWGAGRDVNDLAYIKVGTGVGSGHLVDGHIYRGATGVAGEIGHIIIDPTGPTCVCGMRGCLATFIGRDALMEQIRTNAADQPDSMLASEEPSVDLLVRAAKAGDTAALQLVHRVADRFGIAVSGMINLMNPARVVIGGHLAQLGELLLHPLRTQLHRHTLTRSVAAAVVITSELGARSVAVGAATLILDAALADTRLFPPPASPSELDADP